MSDEVRIPIPIEPEFSFNKDDRFGTAKLNYTVKTISRQEYDAGLVKDWYEKHAKADVQVVSEDTHMPLYAIYGTPLAYHDEDGKRFFSEIRRIADEQGWNEEDL